MKEKNHFKLILFAKTEKSQVPGAYRFFIHFGIRFVIILGAFWRHSLVLLGVVFLYQFWDVYFSDFRIHLASLWRCWMPSVRFLTENGRRM